MQDNYNELFLELDPSLIAVFSDFILELGIEAIEEVENGIYIRSFDDLAMVQWAIEEFKNKLENKIKKNIKIKLILNNKKNIDWIKNYQNSIEPIQIRDFYIHSSWQKSKKNMINIQIDPGLAFGSGHHESTNSCIKSIQEYAKNDYTALDLGCGSGILSIIMAKLGCKVDACDNDEIAIKSTINNAKLNKIKLNQIWLGSIKNKKYNIVVANLVYDVIKSLKNELINSLENNGILILAGILDKYEEKIKEAFKEIKMINLIKSNKWISFVYKKVDNE